MLSGSVSFALQLYSSWVLLIPLDSLAIKQATAAGLKEAHSEFTKIVSMEEDEGTEYYDENHERIGEWFLLPQF